MKKKNIIIMLLIIIIILGIIATQQAKPQYLKEEPNIEENYIEQILSYEENELEENFLNWIEINYGKNVLKKLNQYIKEEKYDQKIWHDLTGQSFIVLKDLFNEYYSDKDNIKIIGKSKKEITISFIGDVSLADNFDIMPYYDLRGGINGILEQDVIEKLKQADILVANNEFTISNRGTKMPNKLYTFRANPERVNIYDEMGVDLVTLANNHVYDFGYDAFIDTLATLKQKGMPYIGAGIDINEATKPYYFIINGYKIGFVNATRAEKYIMTPEATETNPGVLRTYNPEKFLEVIKKTKEESDYVIALIHWGKEDTHELEQVQIDTGKLYIEAGADILIGSHAHVLQGIEFYNNKPIVYNLGDFIFNRESKDTGIFNLKLNYDGTLSYSYIPCYQENYKTSLLKEEKRQEQLINMQKWSVNALFDNDGNITESN